METPEHTVTMYQSPSRYWREAATLIIAARTGHSKFLTFRSSVESDYSVLLLQRSAKSKFMPHRHVYPGGAIDGTDFAAEWIDLFTKVLGVPFDAVINSLPHNCARPPLMAADRKLPLPAEVAFRICAIRETFEEAGILLARNNFPQRENADSKSFYGQIFSLGRDTRRWRNKVRDDASTFLEIFRANQVVPDLWALAEWSNWLTPATIQLGEPPKKPMRFDTMFFLCCLAESPRTSHDKSETVQHVWLPALQILEDYGKQKLNMAGPQIYEPCRIANFSRLQDLHRFSQERQWLGLNRIYPVVIICADGVLAVYEGDELYPSELDIEGHKPMLSSEKNIQELAASPRRNRMLAGPTPTDKLGPFRERQPDCNVQPKYGHVAPISQRRLKGNL